MWKILAVFMVVAVAALFFIMQNGDKVDLQGESTGHATASASADSGTK